MSKERSKGHIIDESNSRMLSNGQAINKICRVENYNKNIKKNKKEKEAMG